MLKQWKTWFSTVEDIDYANEAGCTYQESKEFKAQKYEFRLALERAEIETQNRIIDLDGALVERATRLLRFAKRDDALRYIEKALEINPNNEQALAKKLQIFNEQKRFQESVRLLSRNASLFKAHQFQRSLEKASRGLEEKIVQTVRRGEKDQAAIMVASMDSLCKAFPGLRCPDFGYPQASGQERAIYQQRLNSARSLVSINNLEQAEIMAMEALKYAQD
jgi:tetratricopeptide (TPR) repeat protein